MGRSTGGGMIKLDVRSLSSFLILDVKAFTVDDAVGVGLQLVGGILGGVDRYCIYEGDGELVIEFWRNDESIKLIFG